MNRRSWARTCKRDVPPQKRQPCLRSFWMCSAMLTWWQKPAKSSRPPSKVITLLNHVLCLTVHFGRRSYVFCFACWSGSSWGVWKILKLADNWLHWESWGFVATWTTDTQPGIPDSIGVFTNTVARSFCRRSGGRIVTNPNAIQIQTQQHQRHQICLCFFINEDDTTTALPKDQWPRFWGARKGWHKDIW